jgi:ribulose-phosphate 3-epimerase
LTTPKPNGFNTPKKLPIVAASVLAVDFTQLGAECIAALNAGASALHIDIMDGHFVPNLSMGPAICAAARRACPKAMLDVHLMVSDPAAYAPPFIEAGANHITFHIETVDDPLALRDEIHSLGASAGLALNPETPLEAIEPYIEEFDLLLVMSVHPGFGGQSFIPEVLSKVEAIAPVLRPNQRLEMDGGISPTTAASCRHAGCDVLVAGSAIFGSSTYADVIDAIGGMRSPVS